jgi:hypothetical protein
MPRSTAPLAKLSRILGGLVLSEGPLAHQVLGQLLILEQREVETAAAFVVVSASSRQKNGALWAALRVLAPAVAVHLITKREGERWQALWQRLEEREAEVALRERSQARAIARAGRRRSSR